MRRSQFEWILWVCFFSIIGSTARYIHEIFINKKEFKITMWFVSASMGCLFSTFVGFICSHFKLTNELTYAIVGLCSISTKELIEAMPSIITAIAIFMRKIK